MQAREERPVFVGGSDKRIHILLERQLHADADRLRAPRPRRAFVGRLHQARAAAGDDVAVQVGERRGCALRLLVAERAGLRRAEPKIVTR